MSFFFLFFFAFIFFFLLPYFEIVSLRVFFCGSAVFADVQVVTVKAAAKTALPVWISADFGSLLLSNIFNCVRHVEFCVFILWMPAKWTGFLPGFDSLIVSKWTIPESFD